MTVHAPSLQPAQQIGDYVVERLLGAGGAGEVYCVSDPQHDRRVALKLLPRNTIETRPDFVRAFQREYHRLQLLRHPRIVEVYQYGSDALGIYYTMELLDGPDLKSILPLPWRETCLLLRDVALSLAIVHSRRLLHRDVSPGNVRRARDGRAKLIDFGATVSMGIPCSVVGTPACTAPEALAHEPLDARADLYGLGALAYCLLTGGHAYPASSFVQLPSLWDSPLAPLSARIPDIPKTLDQLIASLLQRDRRLRPSSATEVINHLEAIANLAPVPASEAAQTSFVAPALVGRLPELDLLGFHIANARKGRGGVVLIEGAPGQGRTRLLGQLVVEASQRGVLVAAADTSRGSRRGYEAALALCEAVLRQAQEVPHEPLHELSLLLPQLRGELSSSESSPARQRHALHGALQSALLALTRHVTLIVLVDDLHLCDEPSAAVLATLARFAEEHRLLLVATKQAGAPVLASAALQTIAQHATRVLLRPLDAKSIEALVRSAFVDAPHAKFVSEWVGNLSEGNPGKLVELLRHLVERNLVEFRDGVWVLPESIDPALLPKDVADALRKRVDALSDLAREVAELLCLFVRSATLEDLQALFTADSESGALLGALDELTSADIISGDRNALTVPRPALREILVKAMTAERTRQAHARIGAALARDLQSDKYDRKVGLPIGYLWALAGYHLLLGGERARGAQLWLNSVRYAAEVDYVPIWDGNTWYLDGNLLALAAAEDLAMSRHAIATLRTGVVQTAIHGDPSLAKYGECVLEELERAAGALDYQASAHLADPYARSIAAIQLAYERWRNTSEAERGINPLGAIGLLVGSTFALACIYGHTLEIAKLAALQHKLEPFIPAVPACGTFQQLIEGILANACGQTDRELTTRLESLPGLESDAMKVVVNETSRYHLRGFVLYTIATLEAARDPARGLKRVAQMEAETPFMTFGIWQVRHLAHVYSGDDTEAQACAERMEITAVQDGAVTKYQLHASGLPNLAAAHALAGDLMGLKLTIEQLQTVAQNLKSWQPFIDAARAQYHRLRGQLVHARTLADRATEHVVPGQHRGYGFAQLALLRVLLDADEPAAAHDVARDALEATRAHDLGPELESQLCALGGLALAKLGSLADARALTETGLAIARQAKLAGLLHGDLQFNAAQVALLERNPARFERHAALVARYTCAHHHPVLLVRYKRLCASAAAASLTFSIAQAGGESLTRHTDLRAQLRAELDRKSVARSLPERVLELMLERSGVRAGFLFGLTNERLERIAPADADAPPGLSDAVRACFAADGAVARGDGRNTMTATLTSVVRADNGQLFQVAILHVRDNDGSMRPGGALALRIHEEIPAIPRWDCILALSAVLDQPSRDVDTIRTSSSVEASPPTRRSRTSPMS